MQLARDAAAAGEDALFQRDGTALYDALRHFLSGQDAQRALALDLNGVVQADIAPQVIRSPLEAPSLQRIREFMGVR